LIETDLTFKKSEVEPFRWRGRDFFVKRDDLIDPRFSGNKLRKLYSLFKLKNDDFCRVVSYGGAQSNAMLSIAYLAAMKGWEFVYYVKKMPKWLENSPTGNLKRALELKMELRQLPHESFYENIESIKESISNDEIFVPQGGAASIASEGVKVLAEEILEWKESRGVDSFTVATPSGTGTTALYLAKYLPKSVDVVTTPVVGDAQILHAQWAKLHKEGDPLPKILDGFGKHPFAKPHPAFLETWISLKNSGIEFDLIYAPRMWIELELAYESFRKPLLYIHSGGVSGNESQLDHYIFKGLLKT